MHSRSKLVNSLRLHVHTSSSATQSKNAAAISNAHIYLVVKICALLIAAAFLLCVAELLVCTCRRKLLTSLLRECIYLPSLTFKVTDGQLHCRHFLNSLSKLCKSMVEDVTVQSSWACIRSAWRC